MRSPPAYPAPARASRAASCPGGRPRPVSEEPERRLTPAGYSRRVPDSPVNRLPNAESFMCARRSRGPMNRTPGSGTSGSVGWLRANTARGKHRPGQTPPGASTARGKHRPGQAPPGASTARGKHRPGQAPPGASTARGKHRPQPPDFSIRTLDTEGTPGYWIQAFTVSRFAATQSSATSCGSSLSRPIFRIHSLTTAGSSLIRERNFAAAGLRCSSDFEYAT